jgi:hypothetical protein
MGKIDVCGNKMEAMCHHVNCGVFQLMTKVFCHSVFASVCGSLFAILGDVAMVLFLTRYFLLLQLK